MGFGSIIESLSGGGTGTADHAKIVGSLMNELESRMGGVGGLMQTFQQKGMGSLVQQWSNGQTQAANGSDLDKGFEGSGIVETIAQRTGLSPSTVKSALAVAVPLLVHHAVSNGHVTAEGQPTGNTGDKGDVLRSVLTRML